MTEKPNVPYWHLYADSEGVSRQKRCHMTQFELKSMQPPAAPQWQGSRHTEQMTVMVTVQPAGWTGEWHENPAPQWIIPLSGRWFVEAMDGTRVEMGPGEISFGEDQDCITHDGRTGHLSGTVGNEPAVLMVVQFPRQRDRPTPCRFA
jgi:quercetin dioxygenase-like cupin family protein